MKLYLVTNKAVNYFMGNYYDSFVICCNNEDEAKQSHPSGMLLNPEDKFLFFDWPDGQEHIDIKYLGEADPDLPFGIVCSSFKAG